MRASIIASVAVALAGASPAYADIIAISPSTFNDGNVLADGNQRGVNVIGTFDGGEIVFSGSNADNNFLTTFTGGQARFQGDFTGRGMGTFDLTSLTFASGSGALFSSVEFRLFGLDGDDDATISVTDNGGDVFSFTTDGLRSQFGSAADRFAFQGILGQSIASVTITSADGFQDLRQLRLAGAVAAVVPEPSTWALMILGFGAVGASLRRRGMLATA